VPVRVNGDPVRLATNSPHLLGNALKFNRAREVVVRVKPRIDIVQHLPPVRGGGHGIGIGPGGAAQSLPAVRASRRSTTRKFGARVSGSPFAGGFVELMQGEIGIVSSAEKAQRFGLSPSRACRARTPPPRIRQVSIEGRRIPRCRRQPDQPKVLPSCARSMERSVTNASFRRCRHARNWRRAGGQGEDDSCFLTARCWHRKGSRRPG